MKHCYQAPKIARTGAIYPIKTLIQRAFKVEGYPHFDQKLVLQAWYACAPYTHTEIQKSMLQEKTLSLTFHSALLAAELENQQKRLLAMLKSKIKAIGGKSDLVERLIFL